MSLNLNVPKMDQELAPKITVIGVGGAGGNAVNNMILSNLEGVDFLVANTDAQALEQSHCDRRIQLGINITQGLGAGSRPDVGRAAAEEGIDTILGHLEGTNMVFITAGLGGGTGTGAAPVIARATREAGILTVGVVTKPFHFEGVHRMHMAETGLSELHQYVDTLIIIPNQNLFRVANEKTTFADAFKMADDVLESGVRGVTDLIVMPGLINLDFADIRAVMTEMGKAMMGTGEAEGEHRAIEAAESAISNPLLDDISMKGARGVLINITGGTDLTLFEVDEAANRIRDEVDPDANIIFGSTFDQSLDGKMRVSVVSTGIDVDEKLAPKPVTLSLVSTADQAAGQGGAAPSGGVSATAAQPAVISAPAGQPDSLAADPGAPPAAAGVTEAEAAPRMEAAPAATEPGARDHQEAAPDVRPVATAEPRHAPVQAQGEATTPWDDSFIAPPPVEPEAPAPQRAPARGEADPFAAAAIANGAREQPADGGDTSTLGAGRRRARSLFARMTGAARAEVDAPESVVARPPQPERPQAPRALRAATPARAMPPQVARQAAAPQPARHVTQQPAPQIATRPAAQPAPQPGAQPHLTGLDPSERIAAGAQEEDLLDIPAFLRRQAN